jgi:hypothetical protein
MTLANRKSSLDNIRHSCVPRALTKAQTVGRIRCGHRCGH